MFKQQDSWANQAERCQFDNHFLPLSHICVYKNCEFGRIGCFKCQNILHNHQLKRQSHYLKFEDFQKYIKEIVDCQLLKYKHNAEMIKRLKSENQNSPLIQKTLESLQITQQMLSNNFKLAQNRWRPFSEINLSIIQQMIEMDSNHILRQDQINQILISQIRQIGLQLKVNDGKNEMQNQKFVLEETSSKLQKQTRCYSCEELDITVSPNGAYIGFNCFHNIEIFIKKSSKQIVKKRLKCIQNISFSNDSKFYFICEDQAINCFAIQNSQKRIFNFLFIFDQSPTIFPINDEHNKEVIISSTYQYFIIIKVDNRHSRHFLNSTKVPERYFEYDDQNRIIICGSMNNISFFNYYTSQLIFEQQIQSPACRCWQLNIIKATNQLIISFDMSQNLYMINYQEKELYLLNKFFFSGHYLQVLHTVLNRYPIIMTAQGIIILDEGLNEIQFLSFKKQISYFSSIHYNPILLCSQSNNYKIILILDKFQLIHIYLSY